LPDGYKPFDETIPYKLAKWAKSQGYEVAGDPVKVFGPGWWRYDPEEAAKLLEKHGFYRDEQGKWHLPDGTPWKIDLVTSGSQVNHVRLGYAIAEQWRKFGIDVEVEAIETGVRNRRYQLGDYDVCIFCPTSTQTIDIWRHWQGAVHKMYYKPIGEIATGCQCRWVNDKVSELLDKLALMPFNTPEAIKLGFEVVKTVVSEMPWIRPIVGTRMLLFNTYVWTNWPSFEHCYWEPLYWNPVWTQVMFVYIRPTGNVPSSELGLISVVIMSHYLRMMPRG